MSERTMTIRLGHSITEDEAVDYINRHPQLLAGRAVQDDGLPTVEQLARAFEWVRDPDDPKATVIPTGYATLLSSEVPAIRRRQAELVLTYLRAAPPLHDPQEPE